MSEKGVGRGLHALAFGDSDACAMIYTQGSIAQRSDILRNSKIEQILSFDAIGIIDAELVSEENIDEVFQQVAESFRRFLHFDFGDLEPEMEAQNNISILTGRDLFGSYDIKQGRLHILMMDGRYRLLFEKR